MFEQLRPVSERVAEDVPQAVVVFDPSTGGLSFVNGAAAELFDVRDDRLPELRITDLLPELHDHSVRSFAASVVTRRAETRVHFVLEALRGASFARTGALMLTGTPLYVREVAPQHRAADPLRDTDGERSPADPAGRLGALWKLVVRGGLGGFEHIRALLVEGTRGLGMEHASLGRVEGDEFLVEFAEPLTESGTRVPLERSFVRAALRRSGSFSVLDTARDREFASIAQDMRSFLCVAFRVGEARWALTFASRRPREEPFSDEDWHYVDDLVEAASRSIERREADAHVERLAYSDALTALPNRTALLARLDEAIAEADQLSGRTAVLFLDIDGFKGVNDTVGHRGGDKVLAEVADRLRDTLRREEYIGRLGGDEFAIVMPRVSGRTEIESIAQRIGNVLSFPFGVDDYRFSLSASIGVAIYPDDAPGREELLARADAAMYSAKDDGGSSVRFRDSIGFEGGVGDASDDERAPANGSYLLCYQPILELRPARVRSVEALIRRRDTEHGLLAPHRGWSPAEDEAGRRQLDAWVLREAATQAGIWAAQGHPVRVDVNLAAFDPRELDALSADPELLAGARRLRIEVSTGLLGDAERGPAVRDFVERCVGLGIALTLDGFEGGLEGLSSVASLPIDVVKLGRPMVEGIVASRTARAIVEGAMVVAKSLGWSVVAKGVENAAQRDALVALGCDGLQGFFVAHPMTALEFGSWLREHHYAGRDV